MESPIKNRFSPRLTESARAVFRRLVQHGPATRPQIGTELGLSRPTMSAAVAELERLGYVDAIGTKQGALGRKASEYRAGQQAGHVIAIDAGSTYVRLRVSTLDLRLLYSHVHALPRNHFALSEDISAAVADETAAALAACKREWGTLRAIGIALPTRVVANGVPTVPTRQELIFSRFAPPENVDLVLENNVNCAAVAEQAYGAAQGHSDFAYIQIGYKIGMGFMIGNQLIRGRNGAAGEIGHLPFPWTEETRPKAGEAERYMGSEALMARVREQWPDEAGPPPDSTNALLELARAGNAAAAFHISRHAEDIAAIVASCVSTIDPGLVILGGGFGSAPEFLPDVNELANRLSYPVDVASSPLGAEATVLGIEKLAAQRAVSLLLGQ